MDGPPGAVLGGLVITGTVTAAAGLPLGGVLIDAWGWRTTFLVNVPVGVVAAAITLVWIPPDKKRWCAEHFGKWYRISTLLVWSDLVGLWGL